MTLKFGNGVSRSLEPFFRQFKLVVRQKGKPPLDAEENLGDQLSEESLRQLIRSQIPSGFFTDPTRSREDYITESSWSNFFVLGNPQGDELDPVVWANVNGWIIPVSGTQVSSDGDVKNLIRLFPPPATDSRTDFVFLEVWQTMVAPNPSDVNKPSESKIWKWGNVEYGGTNIDDDLEDPAIGFETTERVQTQYRIRVFGQGTGLGSSVALDVYPDGLDDPNILGQGTATSPVAGFVFSNMKDEMGDPSLWRAGDGNPDNSLGTVDGYVYAIPICSIFRRNTSVFSAIQSAGNPNQNGAFNRNPSASFLTNPREGAKALTTATLNVAIGPEDDGDIEVVGLVGSGLDDTNLNFSNLFVVIDDEIIKVEAVDSVSSPGTITVPSTGRGRGGTRATRHEAGAAVSFYSVRPDGLFADQVSSSDILDLRRSVNFGDWDYTRLLLHNLTALIQNNLQTSFKQSGAGETVGVRVVEVDYMHADGSTLNPNHTEALDGPDGIRTVFSDSASLQHDVTLMLDPDAALTGGFTTDQFDSTVQWTVGADFKPSGFINNLGAPGAWTPGSSIFLYIGGDSGTEGARATFRDGSVRAVRFVAPFEYWASNSEDPGLGKQHPVTMRWINGGGILQPLLPEAPGEGNPEGHPGPLYPVFTETAGKFERPFIVLGGILHPSLSISGISTSGGTPGLVNTTQLEIDLGLDFDALGGFYSLDANGNFESDPTAVTTPLLRGQRTFFDMLTNSGRDRTGQNSEIYVVLYGDTTSTTNNGAFKVVGAGTVGYTSISAANATSIVVEPLADGIGSWTIAAGTPVTVQFRSQYTNAEDGSGFAAGPAASALCIVMTDTGGNTLPWKDRLGFSISSKMVLNLTLQYHPGRGGMARIPDDIYRVSTVNAGSEYLRQAVGTVDATFPALSGLPGDETFYDTAPIQTWNRLPSLGLTETTVPKAPDFGGNVVLFNEQDREAEVFVDKGSKSIVLRPFKDHSMTLQAVTTDANPSLLGTLTYPGGAPKDGAAIFTGNKTMGFPVPSEYMPRFGRYDIPYFEDITGNGSGTFLSGINHLFTDSTDPTEPVFTIIGGQDNTSGGNLVTPMYFQTGSTSGHAYGIYGTIVGPGTPAYQARTTNEIGSLTPEAKTITDRLAAVVSSDFGSGLKGIQLPPYLGIARVYGVYDRADFVAKGGITFESNRVTPAADPATNLLKTDGRKQTLFIFQDGAKDLTLEDGDHTYIVPQEAIDITLSPFFSPGVKDEFEDFEFVVEAAVFGFSKGWINENNYILCRLHDGTGALLADGDDPELEGVGMTLPSPATLNDPVYLLHTRTPYQGDPYMTREGETRTISDYEHRYGEVSIADAFELSSSIEQSAVEIPNARGLEVLSVVDFYTTLGTGNIGGTLYPGTALDVGFTEDNPDSATRIPASSSQPDWRTLTRAFTEGQKENTSRARMFITDILSNLAHEGGGITVYPPNGTPVNFIGVNGAPGASNEYDASDVSPNVVAVRLATAINDHPTISSVVEARVLSSGIDQVTAGLVGRIELTSAFVGDEGNGIRIEATASLTDVFMTLEVPIPGTFSLGTQFTLASMAGGVDLRINAGNGTTPVPLTGVTERLPLGVLLQDSDFLGEDPLNNRASSLSTSPAGVRAVQTALPLTPSGEEYTRFLGDPGQGISLSDGAVLRYEAFDSATAPTGTKRFRIYRGGGATFVLTGKNPGGPINWLADAFPESVDPVLKGGILVCKALLVRNFQEEAFATNSTVSYGDEIQMVILTHGILGNGNTQREGLTLEGIISPTGYGEGYAAADRYRLEGRPMFHGFSRTVTDPNTVVLAPFQKDLEE